MIKLNKVHSVHPGFSEKVQVLYNDVQGRYTIAKQDIKAGEVIALEEANVSFTHCTNAGVNILPNLRL